MASVQEKVKERIQASFMDLIPPEMWEGMVQQHLNEFTRDMLPRLVKEEAEKRLREMLTVEFQKPEWTEKWGVNGVEASEMLSTVLKEAAPNLVAAMFSQLAANIVMDLRNNRY